MVELTEQKNAYLLPDVEKLLPLSREERIEFIKKDNWIGYPRAIEALSKLRELYEYPTRQRMPNLLIIGPTNNGKTMIIEKFMRLYGHPFIKTKEDKEEGAIEKFPVLSIQMPSMPDLKRFFITLLNQAQQGMIHAMSTLPYLESVLYKALARHEVKMIIIDEIHNILAGAHRQQVEFLNVLRQIGNTLRIPLVGVGTKDAYLAIRSDPQLENRFEPFPIPLWKEGKEYDALLASFISILPLRKYSNLYQDNLAQYILAKSEGVMGEIASIMRKAAITAIKIGIEEIDEMTLEFAQYHSPTERKTIFEQELL